MAVLRSRHDRVLAGVCGGIARSLGWNSTAVRILYVIASIVSVAFPGAIVYLVLALVIPLEPETGTLSRT
jgi:phage shock protein PspC (stress-responsive transcriptional regulator)